MSIKPLLIALMLGLSTPACAHGGDRAQQIKSDIEESVFLMKGAGNRHGTGFVIEDHRGRRVIITNAHVCRGNLHVMRAVSHDKKETTVRIIKSSDLSDLCILQAPKRAKALPIADKAYKEKVYAVGHPLSYFMVVSHGQLKGYQWWQFNVKTPIAECNKPKNEIKTKLIPNRNNNGPNGHKVKKTCTMKIYGFFTTIPVERGFSGAPLVNDDGEVVGVIMGMQGTTSYAIAVSLHDLKVFLRLKKK